MYLQRIEMIGFKSFATKTTLEFLPPTAISRGITAIVGPNGSGKSCVVDAIRWVLGEQSMKVLRGKKSEDVIFAGTPKRPRLGVAEVTLHLNNEDGGAPIDYSEIAIGHRVYRSGESEYLLNGQQVRREDILLLLAKARVGQRTYSIIGQGMVDEFLLASPTDRKVFLDEAAGIRPAELKRNHALAKLDAARQNLAQGEALLAELTPRLRSLTRQVQRLERRAEVARELRALLEQMHGERWHALAEEHGRVDAAWRTTDAERRELQTAVDGIQHELQALEQTDGTSDAFLPLQREYEGFVDRRQELRERLLTLRHTHEAQRSAAATILPAAALTEDLDALLRDVAVLLEDLRRIDRLEETRSIVERLGDLHARIRVLRQRCAPDAVPPPPSLAEAEVALRAVEESLADVQRRMTALHAEEQRQRGELVELQRRSHERQLTLNAATARANDLRIALARLEQHREDLGAEIARDLGVEVAPDALPNPTSDALPPNTPHRIARLQRELAAIGSLDEQTIREHAETRTRTEFLTQQTTDLRSSITALERIIAELDREIDRAFHVAFSTINEGFERFFRQLFGGGAAKLALVRDAPPEEDTTDRLDASSSRLEAQIAGIDITATPPGKRIRNIAMLSGGERALTAIALLCAIISSSQSPFVILDEVDAALDESNSVRFAEILKDLARATQFLVVTHNRYTMERAAIIYGITMGEDGASKLLSLKLEEANAVVA